MGTKVLKSKAAVKKEEQWKAIKPELLAKIAEQKKIVQGLRKNTSALKGSSPLSYITNVVGVIGSVLKALTSIVKVIASFKSIVAGADAVSTKVEELVGEVIAVLNQLTAQKG